MSISQTQPGVSLLKNWTVTRKIAGLSSFLILSIFVILIYSVVGLSEIQQEIREMVGVDIPLTEVAAEIEITELEQHILIEKLRQDRFVGEESIYTEFQGYNHYTMNRCRKAWRYSIKSIW